MKKLHILITVLTVSLLVSAHAAKRENVSSLETQQVTYLQEFSEANYNNLVAYDLIVTRCDAVPETEGELIVWQEGHEPQDEIYTHIKSEFLACKGVERLEAKQLREFYLDLVERDIPFAKFLYASKLPYSSKQKTQFLIDSLVIEPNAVNLLTEIALFEPIGLTDSQRYFFINLSEAEMFYPIEYVDAKIELEASLTAESMEQLQMLTTQWIENPTEQLLGTIQQLD